ncbi:MAG: anhydro-N-acetylmuramic acid kinase [Clostridia bacterium]|nr:anhydro-N-acetylmuramic acid kinase [Clostridia bacterium]
MNLEEIRGKRERIVIGMMSGTSVDGVDAALVRIGGSAEEMKVELLAFENKPYPDAVRAQIFELFDPKQATVDKVGYMNFLLGEMYARSALSVMEAAGMKPGDIDIIGSHGQTIWHSPVPCDKDGIPVAYTVQIGEGSVIAERTGVATVSDFRVADMAAGGQGAPLVPFSEYLLYRREKETILLQNIGGIGNVTVMPAGAKPEEVFAFDTGPGNMIIDAVVSAVTNGEKTYDAGGEMGAKGTVCAPLLEKLSADAYYSQPLPKTTGREHFGTQYTADILEWGREHGLSDCDLVATVTDLTAWSIADAYVRYVLPKYQASELIVGGGGSYNKTLMAMLEKRFAQHGVRVMTQEELGYNSDAKEAVAFALLADCCIRGEANTLPSVTGAKKAAVMGKVSLPAV